MYNVVPFPPQKKKNRVPSLQSSHSRYLLAKFLAFEVTLPLMASGLYSDPNSLRKSSYIGRDVSAFMALWKSGLLPFSTWHNVNWYVCVWWGVGRVWVWGVCMDVCVGGEFPPGSHRGPPVLGHSHSCPMPSHCWDPQTDEGWGVSSPCRHAWAWIHKTK